MSRFYHLVAHLIAKLQPAFAGGQAVKSMKNTRHQDLSRRPALMISRIVSRSLFDVPVNNIGPAFRRADLKRMLSSERAACSEPFSDPARAR